MSNQQRQYIKPIIRKAKKVQKVCQDEENNFGLSDFQNDSDEIYNLIEEFSGKCILLPNSEEFDNEDEYQKKNKTGDNCFSYIINSKQQNSPSFEQKLEKNQQSFKIVDNFSSLETQSNISDEINGEKTDYIVAIQGEINYLEGLDFIQKTVISKDKKQKNLKQIKKQNNRNSLLKNLQKKKISKLYRKQ
ncbi:unnamed protein product [Paramecium sonneborni]|uniref:Uncharacterized protein n=1 Tax=Paramecium sonneborni TaxID=65129 RepID=A0A8S1KPK5_9CILI|nr:unnamed protein product [Paramecium sonneborni]